MLDRVGVLAEAKFPYVPGLLSFREAPAVIAAFTKLSVQPDVLICDGQGIAHPRRMGLAAHLGLWLGIPTIGCAKSWFFGEFDDPGPERGDWSPLTDQGETIGAVLRTAARSQTGIRLMRPSLQPDQRDRGRARDVAALPAADHDPTGPSIRERAANARGPE